MIDKLPSPWPQPIRMIFTLPACLWADQLVVVGDLNAWDPAATPLRQARTGVWCAAVDLPAGRWYEFRYLVDGRWLTDYHADRCTKNAYGTGNRLVLACLPAVKADQVVGMLTESDIFELVVNR